MSKRTDLNKAELSKLADKNLCELIGIEYKEPVEDVSVDAINQLLREVDLDFVDYDLMIDENTLITLKNWVNHD